MCRDMNSSTPYPSLETLVILLSRLRDGRYRFGPGGSWSRRCSDAMGTEMLRWREGWVEAPEALDAFQTW